MTVLRSILGFDTENFVWCSAPNPPVVIVPGHHREFLSTHMEMLWATDFFSTEIWALGGLVTFYILFFIKLDTRDIRIAGVRYHPHEQWMIQMARNATIEEWGFLEPGQYLIHDRDSKYCDGFRQILDNAGVKRLPLPPRSPWLNAYAECWVKAVKDGALSRVILFGEGSLRHVLNEYVKHYHAERCHQGNVIPFPSSRPANDCEGPIECRERLGGLLKYYHRKAA